MTRLLRSRQCNWPTAIEVRRSWQARSRICRAAAVPSGDFGPGAYLRPLLFVGRQSSCLHRIFTAQVYRVRCSPSVIGCVLCWGASHDRHHADIESSSRFDLVARRVAAGSNIRSGPVFSGQGTVGGGAGQ